MDTSAAADAGEDLGDSMTDTRAFETKAIFSWNVPAFAGGDPAKFADKLKAAGFEAVYLKMAEGAYVFKPAWLRYPTWGENVKQALIDALRSRGIKVIGWQFNYGIDILGEANTAIAQSLRFDLDGWIFDVESKFEANAAAVANAYILSNKFKTACPDIPLALCSWAQWRSPTGATWHNERMASAFMERCDVGMPMMYWSGDSAERAIWLLNESSRLWKNITYKPLVPVGRAYTGDGGTISPAAIKAFAAEVKRVGLKGISWWALDSAARDAASWGALSETPGFAKNEVYIPIVSTPVPEQPVEQPVTPPETIVSDFLRFEALVDGQNVRSIPSTSGGVADVQRKLKKGEIVTASNVAGSDSWVEIAPGRWAAVRYGGTEFLRKVE